MTGSYKVQKASVPALKGTGRQLCDTTHIPELRRDQAKTGPQTESHHPFFGF